MSKPFSKRQLMDQLEFTAEEAWIILDYQKKLPIIVENDGLEGFCVNARDLWVQLGSKLGKFATWVQRRFDAYGFEKEIDYTSYSQKQEKPQGGRPNEEYLLTIDMAKNLAMVEKTPEGKLARKYFLLMEKAVRGMSKWSSIREPLRHKYNDLKQAIDDYLMRNIQSNADKWDYIIETNAINVIATGFKAQEIRNYLSCIDLVTRDSLTSVYNEYLLFLEELDIVLLGMNYKRYDRYKMLKEAFDVKFPNAIPIKSDINIQFIQKNKERLLQMEKEKEISKPSEVTINDNSTIASRECA